MITLLAQAARIVGMAAAKKLMKNGGVKALRNLLSRNAGQKKVKKAAQATGEYKKGRAKGAAAGAAIATAATAANKKAGDTKPAKAASSTSSKDGRTNPKDYPTYKAPTKSAQSFRTAFAAARKAGKKTFTWEGRKYTTEKKKQVNMADSLNTHDANAGSEPAEHTLAMLEKAEQLEKNNNPERPDWLPEKFASVEAMAQAYTALEQKMGKPEEQEAPVEPSEPETTSTPSNNANEVSEVLDSAGLDFDVFQQEYNENGELSPDAYQALEEAGFPRSLVETYIQGQEALATSATNSMYEIAGGQEGYSQMMEWASNNLDPSEIEAYNATVDTGDEGITRLAVQGLVARYRSEVGTEPSLVEGTTGATSGGRFESAAEVTAAMRDPRYQNDPAYRQRVAQMMARSSVF